MATVVIPACELQEHMEKVLTFTEVRIINTGVFAPEFTFDFEVSEDMVFEDEDVVDEEEYRAVIRANEELLTEKQELLHKIELLENTNAKLLLEYNDVHLQLHTMKTKTIWSNLKFW